VALLVMTVAAEVIGFVLASALLPPR
jgi:hypothetical protein